MTTPVRLIAESVRKMYRGDRSTRAITVEYLDGSAENRPLAPRNDLANHSPDGFAWGYAGSGPAQAALAILADATRNDALAIQYHQRFKFAAITPIKSDAELLIDAGFVRGWIDAQIDADGGAKAEFPGGSYSEGDLLGAAPGHMPLVGTDVEVVAYRSGDDLSLMVNRGFCVYRATLRDLFAATPYQIDTRDTFVIRDLNTGKRP